LGLIQWTDGDGDKHSLSNDQYEDLTAINSYLNWLQNGFGPMQNGYFDITLKTRDNFDGFIGAIFDPTAPIDYDATTAFKSQTRLSNLVT